MSYEGKVVWITGASSGIGEALAYVLAEWGAQVILSARREERLLDVRDGCPHPDLHLVLPLDLADTDSLAVAARKALDYAGHIDVLINNGGISQRSRVLETDLDVDRRIMNVNFLGTVALTKAVLPSMVERGAGHLVVVSSMMGKYSTPGRSAYAASKHALHGYFNALRAEVREAGVGVTIVCPGYIRTDLSINALTADGTPHDKMDMAQQNGLSPEYCAVKLLRAVERGEDETYIAGRKEKAGLYLNRFLPGVFNRVIGKINVT